MKQGYVSAELIHCVGRGLSSDDDRYSLLLQILKEQVLKRPPRDGFSGFRMQMYLDACGNELLDSQIVCFCDIPLPELAIHLTKYSKFGLAFLKTFLTAQGANPVYYIARDAVLPTNVWPQSEPVIRSQQHKDPYHKRPDLVEPVTKCAYFDALVRLYNSEFTYRYAITTEAERESNEFHRFNDLNTFLTFQFMAFLKFFDPSLEEDDPENYYMEREWRVLGDVNFQLNDVVRLIVPSSYEERLKADLPDFHGVISTV